MDSQKAACLTSSASCLKCRAAEHEFFKSFATLLPIRGETRKCDLAPKGETLYASSAHTHKRVTQRELIRTASLGLAATELLGMYDAFSTLVAGVHPCDVKATHDADVPVVAFGAIFAGLVIGSAVFVLRTNCEVTR